MCGAKSDVEMFACNTDPCPCVVSAKGVSAAVGDAVTSSDWWIEKDGKAGRTSKEEFVAEGSQLTNMTALHLRCSLCRCKEGALKCEKRANCCKTDLPSPCPLASQTPPSRLAAQCTFSPWKDEGGCSKACGLGFKVQTRRALTFGLGCGASSKRRTVACNRDPCPCALGPWAAWSPCSAGCGGGSQNRSRSQSGTCKGFAQTEKRACNAKPCAKGEPRVTSAAASPTVAGKPFLLHRRPLQSASQLPALPQRHLPAYVRAASKPERCLCRTHEALR